MTILLINPINHQWSHKVKTYYGVMGYLNSEFR